jgi:hypothetical protein
MMKRNILILGLVGITLFGLFLTVTSIMTPEIRADQDAVLAANRLFQAGNYDDTIRIYEQLLAQGVEDSTVYYNLGNAYYRQGDLGRAILNYQRAAQLSPRDPEIRTNLELARSLADIPMALEAPGPLGALANLSSSWVTINESASLALFFWFFAGFLFFAWRLTASTEQRPALKYGAILALLLLAFTTLSLGARIYVESNQPEGIVVAPVVAVSSEPGEEFSTQFSLHSGAEVNLGETQGQWVQLALPGGAIEGWIPLDAVEAVATGPSSHGTLL